MATCGAFLKGIGVSQSKLAYLSKTFPILIHGSVSKIHPLVNLLKSYELSTNDVGNLITACPNITTCSPERVVEAYVTLNDLFDKDSNSINKLVVKNPRIFWAKTSTIRSSVEFLMNELQLTPEQCFKTVYTQPSILWFKVEDKSRRTIDFLRNDVGISSAHLGTVVAKFPGILAYSVEDNLVPKIAKLKESFQIETNEDLSNMILRFPGILGHHHEENLLPKINLITAFDETVRGISKADTLNALKQRPRTMMYGPLMLIEVMAVSSHILRNHGACSDLGRKVLDSRIDSLIISHKIRYSKFSLQPDDVSDCVDTLLRLMDLAHICSGFQVDSRALSPRTCAYKFSAIRAQLESGSLPKYVAPKELVAGL